MVDTYGRWMAEDDYISYPKEKWCDCDRVAAWIMEKGYRPKTSIENLVYMILLYYDGECEDSEQGYYCYPSDPRDLAINMKDLEAYVDDNGIEEFDYEA